MTADMTALQGSVTRRGFLKGAAACGAAAAAATGALGARAARAATREEDVEWSDECDVLVLGGGGAGSAAAYGAASEGAKVVVLESLATVGQSSTALCGGYFSFVGTPAQEAAGIRDSFDIELSDLRKYGGDAVREDVVRTFVDHGVEYYELLIDLGVEWVNRDTPRSNKNTSVNRVLQVNAADHQEKVYEAAVAAGAEYRFSTTAERLVVDGSGRVVGAVAEDGTAVRAGRGVVVATGGFSCNDEMLGECMQGLSTEKVRVVCCPGHTGKGHRMMEAVGAPVSGRSTIYACPGLHPDSVGRELQFTGYAYGAIDVDARGRRYCDESAYYCYQNTAAFVRQPAEDGKPVLAYQVFDQKAVDTANAADATFAGISDTVMEHLVVADTLEGLAEALGMPYLVDEVARYNADIEANGMDTVFGRSTLNGEGTGAPVALDTPPFYAWPQNEWMLYTCTAGVAVNGECQPLDAYGEPVEGVYLAGEIMVRSLVGDSYPAGTSTAAAGALGYYVGRKLGRQ